MRMKSNTTLNSVKFFVSIFYMIVSGSCIVQFVPELVEDQELLVVEGLITDQPGPNTVKLSKSLPLGTMSSAKPLGGCSVQISDDLGNYYNLYETGEGIYTTDPVNFKGVIGRSYSLHIDRNLGYRTLSYESSAMVMNPVPPIDSIYYEKKIIKESFDGWFGIDECQIYLDTHDPENECKYYRWTFSETWILRLLFPVPNMTCWVTANTKRVNVKNASSIQEASVNSHPITYISNATDRLKVRYSILVTQHSLSEEEYTYWDKVNNFIKEVGGLYDIIPSSVPNNIHCIGNPDEKVLGYFSVSSVSTKRIYIQDNFSGIIDQYPNCINDTIYGDFDPPELNVTAWTLIDHPAGVGPRERVLTYRKACADCTTRGTTIKPDFWIDGK